MFESGKGAIGFDGGPCAWSLETDKKNDAGFEG